VSDPHFQFEFKIKRLNSKASHFLLFEIQKIKFHPSSIYKYHPLKNQKNKKNQISMWCNNNLFYASYFKKFSNSLSRKQILKSLSLQWWCWLGERKLVWLMLMWVWAGWCRLVQATTEALVVERERECSCGVVEREIEAAHHSNQT
jgi:hypothetical protein